MINRKLFYERYGAVLSDFIRDELKRRGWTQLQLSVAANVSPAAVSHVLYGTRCYGRGVKTDSRAEQIARGFGWTKREFFELAGVPFEPDGDGPCLPN